MIVFRPTDRTNSAGAHVDKVVSTPESAVADIPNGARLAVGGFGMCGVPTVLLGALLRAGVSSLETVSNNIGLDELGLGALLKAGRVGRITASYIGDNREAARQYLSGEVEIELIPQGSLAEKLRAAGSGIPAFYTPAGVGTMIESGGLPWRYGEGGSVVRSSAPKETREFAGRTYLLEESIFCDFGLVRAAIADRAGNLVFREAARNFNPLAAMAGRITIAEAEEVVEIGEIPPDAIHLPGVFVQRVVAVPEGTEKIIERLPPRQGATS
jgi:3-oxoacid CoA-transferase subunit A